MLYRVSVVQNPSHAEQLAGKAETVVLCGSCAAAETSQGAILRIGVENADAIKKAGTELGRLRVIVEQVG